MLSTFVYGGILKALKNKLRTIHNKYYKYFFKQYCLLIFFSCFILTLSFVNLISKDKQFSDMENRYLQQKPKFSFHRFVNSNFSARYEEFINDQFVFRNKWINLKALSETLLLKTENNDIIIGKHNYLFDKLTFVNAQQITKNIEHINRFINKNKAKKIYISIVPNSYEILKENLPVGLNNINQEKYIKNFYKKLNSSNSQNLILFDAVKVFKNQKELSSREECYYCTDHHWTTHGAYLFYQNFIRKLGKSPMSLENHKKFETNNFYGTYYSRAKIFWKKPDSIIYYDIPINSLVADGKPFNSLYNYAKFGPREKDKYSGFLQGNNGITVIDCQQSKNKEQSILIIKDSYANSFVPFLTCNFNKIYLIDLRYTNLCNLKTFVKKNEINNVFIIYNFINFISDNNIEKLADINIK